MAASVSVDGVGPSRLLGARTLTRRPDSASGDTAEPVMELTRMEIGGVTPIGLPDDLPVLVDSRVMEPAWIVLGGGTRSSKLRVAPHALDQIPSVRVIEGLAFVRG